MVIHNRFFPPSIALVMGCGVGLHARLRERRQLAALQRSAQDTHHGGAVHLRRHREDGWGLGWSRVENKWQLRPLDKFLNNLNIP